MQAEVEEAWRAKSVQLRRSRLADEGAARVAEQRMQGAQQRATQQQRERQQRDAALQVQPSVERKPLSHWARLLPLSRALLPTLSGSTDSQPAQYAICIAWPSSALPSKASFGAELMTQRAREMTLLQAAAERERQKAQAAASAERAAFEAQEARMAAELEQRTHQHR